MPHSPDTLTSPDFGPSQPSIHKSNGTSVGRAAGSSNTMDSPSVGRATRTKSNSAAIAVNAIKSQSLPQGLKGGLDPIAAALRLNRSGGGKEWVGNELPSQPLTCCQWKPSEKV